MNQENKKAANGDVIEAELIVSVINSEATVVDTKSEMTEKTDEFLFQPRSKSEPDAPKKRTVINASEEASPELPKQPAKEAQQSIVPVVTALEAVFHQLNKKFFESTLSKPIFTVTPSPQRKDLLGWCTSTRVWVDENSDGYFEINICAEHLNRPFEEISETLLHEMCHLLNAEQGVNDTSRSGTYHNRKFKETAESHGLEVSKTANSKYGYSATHLTPKAREFITSLNIEWFNLYRELEVQEVKVKSSTLKYKCPYCESSFRATKELNVRCVGCDVLFEIQE